MNTLRSLISMMGAAAAPAPQVFTDDFQDGIIDPLLWGVSPAPSSNFAAPRETGGYLELYCSGSYAGAGSVGMLSVPSLDFSGKTLLINHSIDFGSGGASGSYLQLTDDANSSNYVNTINDGGTALYRLSNNGSVSQLAEGIIQNEAWKMVHNAGTNTWEYWVFNTTFLPGFWSLRYTSPAAAWNPTSVKLSWGVYQYGFTNSGFRNRAYDIITDATY